MLLRKYATALLQVAIVAVTAITTALTTANGAALSVSAVVQIGILVVGAIGTFWVPLSASCPWNGVFKTGVSLVAAGLAAVAPLVTGHPTFTMQNDLIIALAVLSALAAEIGTQARVSGPTDAAADQSAARRKDRARTAKKKAKRKAADKVARNARVQKRLEGTSGKSA